MRRLQAPEGDDRHVVVLGGVPLVLVERLDDEIQELVRFRLGQLSHELRCRIEGDLLRIFLDLDRPSKTRAEDTTLRGVRKAQVKLASYYVLVGAEAEARLIHDDMVREPRERLRAIRDELARVESKDFWEIIDRGRNFEYMPARQKEQMDRFFALLPDAVQRPSTPGGA